MRYLEKSNSQRQKVEWWLPEAGVGTGDGGLLFNGYGVMVLQGKQVLEMDGGDGCTTV